MAQTIRHFAPSVLLLLAALAPQAQAAAGNRGLEPGVDTYCGADGVGYFAVRLAPNVALPKAGAADIMVLFDTSASQTNLYRDKALTALDTFLATIDKASRVQLFAVDLNAVSLTSGFVSPASEELRKAVSALKHRAPLGSTDMPSVLQTALESFPVSAASKSLVYIGDGQSTANFWDTDRYQKAIDKLVALEISVTSYGVGPRIDGPWLASLANQTGGMLALDDDEVDAKLAGTFLSTAVASSVVWPRTVTWPKQFAQVYPRQLPPLRSDRETIVIGMGTLDGEQKITMNAAVNGKTQSMSWTLSTGGSNPDFAFLPALVEGARADGGLRLITLGTPGLNEARRIVADGAAMLAKLGQQAVITGNLETAERLTREALRRDPEDLVALSVEKRLQSIRAGAPLDAASHKVEIKRFSSEQAPPPVPDMTLRQQMSVATDSSRTPYDSINDGEGRLLESVEQENKLISAAVQKEVENELREARGRMTTDPSSVEQGLKLMLERVAQTPELRAELRATLRGQLEVAVRQAATTAATKEILDIQAQEARAAAFDRLRIANALERDQEKIKQLMDRFNSLMDEGRYTAADNIGSIEMQAIAPDLPISTSARIVAHFTGARMASLALRQARQKGVVDTLQTVEFAHIPFPDDQPVVYPDADVWVDLSLRRRKYKEAVDLKKVGPAEKRIRDELSQPTQMEFADVPLTEAIDYIKDLHGIEIQLDQKALDDAAISPDVPIQMSLKGVSLRSGLKLLLGKIGLAYFIEHEVLLVTTPEVATGDRAIVRKAYPVADLVIPVPAGGGGAGGGMGGMMGGMGGGGMGGMGGGMGGMGGGMGGMGGGMGGMGGGMGGMGGGMGGGMFAVADDLKLAPKTDAAAKSEADKSPAKAANPAAAKSAPKAANQKSATKSVTISAPANTKSTSQPAQKIVPLSVQVSEGTDPATAWNAYFAVHDDVSPAAVRETVRQLGSKKRYAEAIALIEAALINGAPQSWMYESLALVMIANGNPPADVERSLMSAVDLADSSEDFMYLGWYLKKMGFESRALKVFRQVALMEPLRPEPYLHGLQLAEQLRDLDGIRWSTLGILKQAWPKDKADFVLRASRAANAAVNELKTAGLTKEAAEFQADIERAKVRDCLIKVTWTGDADVDLMIEEPSGSVCSFHNPRTTSGGVLLSDAPTRDGRTSIDGQSETYTCAEAFPGTYRVLVRRVWGKVTAGKVTVDVYSHYGSPAQKHLRQQIPLGDTDSAVAFDLDAGRRQEPLGEQQLANAAATQLAVNSAILAQQVDSLASANNAGANFNGSRAGLMGIPFVGGAVGYQPQIQVLPQGTQLTALGVISADRRFVRVTPVPTFSGVGSVTTYNLQQGSTATTSGAAPAPGANPNPGAAGT